jgi:hypothetical protein
MKKSELKQLIREAIEAEMNRKNSSIDVVKNTINNKYGITTVIDKTEKFIVFPEHQNIPDGVTDDLIKLAPNTKVYNGGKSLTLKDGKAVHRRAIEFL